MSPQNTGMMMMIYYSFLQRKIHREWVYRLGYTYRHAHTSMGMWFLLFRLDFHHARYAQHSSRWRARWGNKVPTPHTHHV